MKVGWIGLGDMGLRSARKVAASGHDVRAYDLRAIAPGDAPGLTLCASASEAAVDCDMLCLAVFSDEQVEDVLFGPHGVMAQLKPGTIVAIFTTGGIKEAREIASRATQGVAVLDTCFSKMHKDRPTGMMTLLIGGEAEAIERGRPVFEAFARAIHHVGSNGAGRAIKLVNNMLYAAHLQVAADAVRMAEGFGLEPRRTAAALMECSGSSNALEIFTEDEAAAMVQDARRYMLKDVAAATESARRAGIELDALQKATSAYLPGRD